MRQSEQQGIASRSPCPLISQDNCGRWVVLDRQGHCDGLFASSKEAIHFAMFESERGPQAAIMADPNWRWVREIKPVFWRRLRSGSRGFVIRREFLPPSFICPASAPEGAAARSVAAGPGHRW